MEVFGWRSVIGENCLDAIGCRQLVRRKVGDHWLVVIGWRSLVRVYWLLVIELRLLVGGICFEVIGER